MNNSQVPEDYVIFSLDVVSQITNIPMELFKESIDKKWQDIASVCDIPS